MADFKYFEKIEAYVNKTMPAEERVSFEVALKQDEVLQKEYRAYQATLVASDILGLQVLEEMANENKRKVIAFRRWINMAAAILVLGICGMLIFANLNYRSTQILSEAMDATTVNFSDTQSTEVNEAWQAFQNEDYNTTLQLLSPDRNDQGFISEEVQLLYSYALIEQGMASSAIPLLVSMDQNIPEVSWYLTLAYLQAGQKAAAKESLNKVLEDPQNPYREAASQIQQKMNSFFVHLTW